MFEFGNINRNEFKKILRKASHSKFVKTRNQLRTEIARLNGTVDKASGTMKEDQGNLINARFRLACLLTIAKERGIKL